MRHEGLQGIIYEAMPGYARQAFEARTGDGDAEVPALTGAGMAGVQVAVVTNLEGSGREGRAQGRLDFARRDRHGGSRREATAAPGRGALSAGSPGSL